MLSKLIIETIGQRVRSMTTCGGTIFSWDIVNSRIISPSTPYLPWNWRSGLLGGYLICVLHVVQLYTKLLPSKNDLVDEAVLTEQEAGEQLREFAVIALEISELLSIIVVCLIASHIDNHRNNVMYLLNQMFVYHGQVEEMLETRQITLDAHHKRTIRDGECLLLFISVVSYFFPFALMACIFHPLEPHHLMIKEWLDFDVSMDNMKLIHFLFVPFLWGDLHSGGSTIIMYAFFVTCYNQMASLLLEDMTPVRYHPGKHKRGKEKHPCIVHTKSLGLLTEEEVIHLYRIQQLFLNMVNEIMASFPVSVHHVATLVTVAVLIYFSIKFDYVLKETGLVGYISVWGVVFLALFLEFMEARMLGDSADISRRFKQSGMKVMVRRKSLFYKFFQSCSTIHVQEAYPYYNVDRSTFLQFGSQVVDHAINLLLWET